MLQSTFIHIPGISKTTEEKLWNCNIKNWDDFLYNKDFAPLNETKKDKISKAVMISKENYNMKNHSFFSRSLSLNEHWRTYPDFRGKCCFLDIETTGLCRRYDKITTIGLYDGITSRVFVRGKDMQDFLKIIKNYSLIVTFNGRCFDLPFIKSTYPQLEFNQLHVDLRFVLKTLGYKGGLKNIEKELGFKRDSSIEEVDGFEAVRLWKRYELKSDKAALEKLIAYNKADAENLQPLMEFAFEKIKEKTFLDVFN